LQFFEMMQRGEAIIPGVHILGAWGYPPTKAGLLLQSELYGEHYRRVFWAAAYEQVTFSHQEPLTPSRQWPFRTIRKPLLLASGTHDVGSSGVMDIYNHVVFVSNAVPDVPGRRLLMKETGHSIAEERPSHLAERIVDFLPPPPPRWTDISFLAPLLLQTRRADTSFLVPLLLSGS
jgi:pimeloyl-ACP methyl ester carboxylesterase